MKGGNMKEIYMGVGNYELNFSDDHSLDLSLNYIQEDKIVWTENANYLIFRHVTIDLFWFAKVCRGFKNKIESINYDVIHQDMETAISKITNGVFKKCKLKYIVFEGDCQEHKTCKMVFEFEDMEILNTKER